MTSTHGFGVSGTPGSIQTVASWFIWCT